MLQVAKPFTLLQLGQALNAIPSFLQLTHLVSSCGTLRSHWKKIMSGFRLQLMFVLDLGQPIVMR